MTSCRFWRVLRSWTTACCWGSMSRTRARERGLSRVKQGGMEGDLWVRGCSTPQPWSPSREMARLLKPSPQMTRELAQLWQNTYYAHIFGHTHSVSVRLLISTFSLTDTVAQPCSYLTQDTHTVRLSYNHSYTTQTQQPFCVFTAMHLNVNTVSAPFTNTCKSPEAHLPLFELCATLQKKNSSHSMTAVVFLLFQDGWYPCQNTQRREAAHFPGYHRYSTVIQVFNLYEMI